MTPLITGTDFITVATQDFEAAVAFYGGLLELPESKRWGTCRRPSSRPAT